MIKQNRNTVVSLSERRKHPRVSDAVALRLNFEGNSSTSALDPTPTHIVKMSCGGLRFLHNTALDADSTLPISMHLPSADKTVHIDSRVISSGEEKSGSRKQKTYFVQVEFQQVDDQVRSLLQNHISYVLDKIGTAGSEYYYSA